MASEAILYLPKQQRGGLHSDRQLSFARTSVVKYIGLTLNAPKQDLTKGNAKYICQPTGYDSFKCCYCKTDRLGAIED